MYTKIATNVTIFSDFWAELGDPNKSLFVAKLLNPELSCGIRKEIMTIKKILIRTENNFIIGLELKKLQFISYFEIFQIS
jgi:hypothetical protein